MSLINKEKSLYVMGLILAILLILSGCGKDRKEINVKADTGETVQATLQLGDDFDMNESSGVLMVYQKKKVMLQVAFINEEQRKTHIDHMRNSNMTEVLQEEGKSISYKKASAQGLVNYFIFPVGEKTYAYEATYLPEEAAKSVLNRLEFQKK